VSDGCWPRLSARRRRATPSRTPAPRS
jgi:hypothetical protein